MNKPLWSPAYPEKCSIARLQSDLGFDAYTQLHHWSITEHEKFWSRAWDDLQIAGEKGSKSYRSSDKFMDARFFPDSSINVAENLLAKGDDDQIAIVSLLENGQRQEITWKELRQSVASTAAAFKQDGVTQGDCIAAWSTNSTEVVIWALAALSLGAIVSTASPDFAPNAVADRFGQINPKLLLVADSYIYNGKTFELDSKIKEITKLLPSVQRVVRLSELNSYFAPFTGAPLSFTRLPFDHPGFVLFSSGTTGKPKCIIHSAAGILLKVGVEHHYHFDISKGERVFYFTTCGWMMWNWLVMALARGATIILYDGSPVYPALEKLVAIGEDEKVHFLGLSAKYIDSLRNSALDLKSKFKLDHLRVIGSTGSVLSPEGFDYIYESVKKDVQLASLSGGTDICGCFALGVPTLPVFRGELQGACLGMATNVFNSQGLSAAVGEKGELVCTAPFPSMPIGFWGDADKSKYSAAYFEKYPNVWTHGDFAAKSENHGFIIYGRSDATLNSRGVRIGTAEIYRVVEGIPEISECMAVSQDWEGDTRVILFVVMRSGEQLNDQLQSTIKKSLRDLASPRHVPDLIVQAPDLPRTKSNKLVELAVTDIINGREVRNSDGLANPEALNWFSKVQL